MMVCNHHFPELQRPICPGSMGHAMPGFRIVILNSDGESLRPGKGKGPNLRSTHKGPFCSGTVVTLTTLSAPPNALPARPILSDR
ncbi:MAG: hypothetical protein CM1200mP18_15880 [Gammaproteobacteria bacterium]|nr:MAG: hypothetical protein CM1200mP18_15880 [Gammaproteobacteria bacterium]